MPEYIAIVEKKRHMKKKKNVNPMISTVMSQSNSMKKKKLNPNFRRVWHRINEIMRIFCVKLKGNNFYTRQHQNRINWRRGIDSLMASKSTCRLCCCVYSSSHFHSAWHCVEITSRLLLFVDTRHFDSVWVPKISHQTISVFISPIFQTISRVQLIEHHIVSFDIYNIDLLWCGIA